MNSSLSKDIRLWTVKWSAVSSQSSFQKRNIYAIKLLKSEKYLGMCVVRFYKTTVMGEMIKIEPVCWRNAIHSVEGVSLTSVFRASEKQTSRVKWPTLPRVTSAILWRLFIKKITFKTASKFFPEIPRFTSFLKYFCHFNKLKVSFLCN